MNEFTDDKTKTVTGITLGSRFSDKYVVIYNKTNELLISEKKYIADFWEQNGLIVNGKSIDRLELRLRTKELQGLEKDLQLLNNQNFLASLIKNRSKNHLTFISKKNKKEYNVIDWSGFNLHEIKKEKRINFHMSTQRVKSTLKTIYLESNFEEKVFDTDFRDFLLEKYRLAAWYLKSQYRWKKENPVFKNQVL